MTPDKRPVSDITAEFAARVDWLSAMAGDWSVGQFRHHDLANADDILRRLVLLLAELGERGET